MNDHKSKRHILVLGASGNVGREVVSMAVSLGHQVTAVSRNISEVLDKSPDGVVLRDLDVFDLEGLIDASRGVDAIVSCLGPGSDGNLNLLFEGMGCVIAAARANHIERILGIGGAGLLEMPDGEGLWKDDAKFPSFLRDISAAHYKSLLLLQKSGINWTFVCPPMMQSGPVTCEYRTRTNMLLPGGFAIRFSDVAHFLVTEIESREFINEKVAIAY
jgi:putative NADH-flavin reductase